MHLVIVAWLYVVVMMALAEALSSQGTVLGAVFTLVLYGLLPLSIVVYILGTPARKRARAAREAMASADEAAEGDARGEAAVGAPGTVAPKREEPGFIGVGIEREPLDRADSRLFKPRRDGVFEIELEVIWPPGSEESVVGCAVRQKPVAKRFVHFIA